jgi:hypothetical protein
MKKALLSLIALASLFSSAAKADDMTANVLSLLIQNAAKIKLVDSDGKKVNKSFYEILGRALAVNNLVNEGEATTINSVSAFCEIMDDGMRVGYTNYDCTLSINNGDYVRTKNGYKGPSTESSYRFNFKAGRVVVPGAKLELLGDELVFSIAG